MFLTATGKIAVATIASYVLLGIFTYCFLWDKLPVKRDEISVKFFDKICCKISFEWIEGKFVNSPPFQPAGGGIPVFGMVRVKLREKRILNFNSFPVFNKIKKNL